MGIDLAELSQALTEYLRPACFPVAVRMIEKGEALPEKARHPLRDLDIKVATCQAISFSRIYGWVMAVGEEDFSCPLTAVVFGFRKANDFYHRGNACEGFYTRTAEAGRRSEAGVEKYEFGQYEYILTAPLHRAEFEPDVVVVYANSAQVLRLLNASLWESGGRLTSSFGGRIDCAEEIIAPQRSGQCEIILPCYGDRIFAQTQDSEMAFSIPKNRIEEIISGLAGTHKVGVRYPIPAYLRYTGQFPPSYTKVSD